ncbi:MAG: nucleoside-diphosphate kinase [Verrucomicrobiota bacterium]
MQTSLILLKSDCVSKKLCGEVIKRFEDQGFKIRGIKMLEMSDALLHEHYAHIADLPFFPKVVKFMQETPVIALALAGDNAVERVRDLLGPTDSTQANPGTIRGDYGFKDGDSKMRNVCHASDSPENAEIELNRFFKPEELFDY